MSAFTDKVVADVTAVAGAYDSVRRLVWHIVAELRGGANPAILAQGLEADAHALAGSVVAGGEPAAVAVAAPDAVVVAEAAAEPAPAPVVEADPAEPAAEWQDPAVTLVPSNSSPAEPAVTADVEEPRVG